MRDTVTSFSAFGDLVKVTFELSAGEYAFSRKHPHFDAVIAAIARSWQKRAAVTITARGTEIIGVAS